MSSLRDWEGYNEALVKRGLILLDLDFVANWSEELKAMNTRKEGARYTYPESFIKLLAVVHAYVLPSAVLSGSRIFYISFDQRKDSQNATKQIRLLTHSPFELQNLLKKRKTKLMVTFLPREQSTYKSANR